MSMTDAWDGLLRGAVGGVLLFHVIHLLGPGARRATRAALLLFTLSVLAYLFCQKTALLVQLPRPVMWAALSACSSATVWLWLAARALFDDRFRWSWPYLAAGVGMVGLSLAAHAPRFAAVLATGTDPGSGSLTPVHAVAMVAFTAAAVWEVLRGWSDDLVEPRRVARRWAALGIGLYAAIALAVELALQDRPAGPVLPALHVMGIGAVAMSLAVLVARRSLDVILGPEPAAPVAKPRTVEPIANSAAPVAPRTTPALERLLQAMTAEHVYRRDGLTVAALAADLGMGEAALRSLINQQLGHRNFNDFLHHYRLQEAATRLVAEDRPILTIALECGYGSIGPFNRAFRQRFGMTPTEYRAGARLAQHNPPG
jgi:AraC-like DNA-binding protein